MTDITRLSLDEIRKKNEDGAFRVDPDAPDGPDIDDAFWAQAKIVAPTEKRLVSIRVDQDIYDFFKAQGARHTSRMHSVLRAYVDAKRAETER